MSIKSIGIYQIRNLINGHIYIGSTEKNFQHRWSRHLAILRKNKHHSRHLQNAWNKYKEENFIFEILEIVTSGQCLVKEQEYLDRLKPLYNVNKLATSRRGVKATEETKKKISAVKTGVKLYYPITEKRLQQWKNQKGKPVPQERKDKISKTLSGKMNFSKSTPIVSFEIKTQEFSYFASVKIASTKLGIGRSGIANVLCGLSNHSGGFLFAKLEDFLKSEDIFNITGRL